MIFKRLQRLEKKIEDLESEIYFSKIEQEIIKLRAMGLGDVNIHLITDYSNDYHCLDVWTNGMSDGITYHSDATMKGLYKKIVNDKYLELKIKNDFDLKKG